MAVVRLAPVNVGTSVMTAHPIYFICDTTTELNALTGLKLGDSALAKDTNVLYKAASASTWTPVDAGATQTNLGAEVVVASNDAPAAVKSLADFTCDSTADQTEINLAIDRAAAIAGRTSPGSAAPTVTGAQQRGAVRLTGGRFTISAPILMRTGVRLTGAGTLTDLKAATTMTNAGAGTRIAVIKKFDVNQSNVMVDHIMINASGSNAQDAIYFNNDGSSYAAYPSGHTGDSCDVISDYTILNVPAGNGIHMSSNDSSGRGFYIGQGRIHNCLTTAVWIEGTPDGHIYNVQVGAGQNGFVIAGGNIKMTNCKAFYSDTVGFSLTSGRGVMSACEAQDCVTGFDITSSPWSISGIEADTCQTTGIRVASSNVSIVGATSFVRSGGRYGTMTNGILASGSLTDLQIMCNAMASNVTNPSSGTWSGARNFVRIDTGTALTAVG